MLIRKSGEDGAGGKPHQIVTVFKRNSQKTVEYVPDLFSPDESNASSPPNNCSALVRFASPRLHKKSG